MRQLSECEYLELFELTKQWCHNFNVDNALLIQEKISDILHCSLEDAIKEVDKNYPEIYESITRPLKEDLATVFPNWFSEYVK